MPRPILLSGAQQILILIVLLALWVAWCMFAVAVVVPMLERHLTVYYAWTAWLLCMVPVIAVGILASVRLSAEGE